MARKIICSGCKKLVDREHICIKGFKTIKPRAKTKTYEQKQAMNDEAKKEYNFYISHSWKKRREQVMVDSLCQCQVCMHKQATQVHHIIPIRKDFERRLEFDNLICCCDECHKIIHKYKVLTSEKLEKFIIQYRNHLEKIYKRK